MEGLKMERNTVSKKPCIWVVDDDENCRDLFSQLLSIEMSVEYPRGFGSAGEMLTALGRQPAPEVILMDFQMPGINGIEAIPMVHQLAPDTQVVMISSFLNETHRRNAMANGATDFLHKNSPPDRVADAIRHAVSLTTPANQEKSIDGI